MGLTPRPLLLEAYFYIMDKNLQAYNEIKSFIRFNEMRRSLHIDFDSMCMHLLNVHKRSFSPSELERHLGLEVKKLEGKSICPEMFDEIARYINEMTLYMHQQGSIKGEERNEKLKKRFDNYRESLAKAKRK
jgi:hypothetical protein